VSAQRLGPASCPELDRLFATDGVIELPFAVEGLPTRLEGREAIRAFSTTTADRAVEITDLRITDLHQTNDPEVVIIELVTEGRHTTTGTSFETQCIQVFHIYNGKIKLFRDQLADTCNATAATETLNCEHLRHAGPRRTYVNGGPPTAGVAAEQFEGLVPAFADQGVDRHPLARRFGSGALAAASRLAASAVPVDDRSSPFGCSRQGTERARAVQGTTTI
jgi:ketosteroid isomerase-like protein